MHLNFNKFTKTKNIQFLNVADIDYFYNIDESLYGKLQYHETHVQAVNLFMFVRFFLLEKNGSDKSIT